MKPMSLLAACGIIVSLTTLAAPAYADQYRQNAHRRPQEPAGSMRVPPFDEQPSRLLVPRGDLRGDITNNARTRNTPQQQQPGYVKRR